MTGLEVLGIGIDLVENDRMQAVLDKWGVAFLAKVFLTGERDYCEGKAAPWRHYAARFAVKEAVAKAFGTGIEPRLGWLDIQVERSTEGRPLVRLSSKAQGLADEFGVRRVLVSLSHTRHYAAAHAVLLGLPRKEAETGP